MKRDLRLIVFIFVSFYLVFFHLALWGRTYRTPHLQKTRREKVSEEARVFDGGGVSWLENYMSEDVKQSGDEKLERLVRAARPSVELPPGFQSSVWRRIE